MSQHIQVENVLRAVSLDKDVDGLHPINVERLVLRGVHPTFIPCTPLGCLELLRRSGLQIENKHAVVIGCSNVVGLPTALLLQVQLTKTTFKICMVVDLRDCGGAALLCSLSWKADVLFV